MLLKLAFATLASLAMVMPAITEGGNACQSEGGVNAIPAPRFSRVIVLAKHAPASASVPGLDPNHMNAINNGLITAAEADELVVEAIDDFHTKFGFDLSTGTLDPATGVRTTAEVICQPALTGLDKGTVLVSDSANPFKEFLHSWFTIDYSQMFIFRTSGVVPGGTYAGRTYNAGDVFVYGYSNLLRNNSDWSKSSNREKFKLTTTILAKQLTNILGKRQFLITFDVADEDNNAGYWLQATSIAPENGIDYLQSRIVMTWDCPAEE
jgi:hypothetical protein